MYDVNVHYFDKLLRKLSTVRHQTVPKCLTVVHTYIYFVGTYTNLFFKIGFIFIHQAQRPIVEGDQQA